MWSIHFIHVLYTISFYQRIMLPFFMPIPLTWLIPMAAGVEIGMIVMLFWWYVNDQQQRTYQQSIQHQIEDCHILKENDPNNHQGLCW